MTTKRFKLIIFDFDGVMANSFDCFYSLIKAAMASVDLSISRNQYRSFFMGNVHQGFRDFIKDEVKYKLFSEFRRKNYDTYYKPGFFPGMAEVVKNLTKTYKLAIASSGKKENIIELLSKSELESCFEFISATNEYSKERMILEILKQLKCQAEQALMITDTVGDVLVAQKLGLKTAAVTWGFHSKKTLGKTKVNMVFDDAQQLQAYLS